MTQQMTANSVPIDRPAKSVIDGFRAALYEYSPSCLVADAQARRGSVGGFTTVDRQHKIAGPALTLQLQQDELADWPSVLLNAQAGDVLVIAAGGQARTALWGGLMSTLAQQVGLVGVIVDGAVRDVDEIRDLGFPVWHRGTAPRPSPTFVHGRTEPVEFNVPVVVDGQIIQPGDLVIADEIGFTVVERSESSATLTIMRELIAKEKVMRHKISGGMTVTEVLAEFGKI